VALLVLGVLLSGAAADTVTYVNTEGRLFQRQCTILSESYDFVEIEIEQEGEKKRAKIPTKFVQDINRTPVPSAYQMGVMRMKNQDWAEAATSFLEVADDAEAPEWSRWYAAWEAGSALMSLADATENKEHYEAAVKAFDRILKNWPKARYAPDAAIGKAAALAQTGNTAEARALLNETLQKDYPDTYTYKARVTLGRLAVLEAQKLGGTTGEGALGRVSDEMTKLAEEIANKKDATLADLENEALLVKAEALLAKTGVEDHRQAEAICREVVLKAKDERLKAEAANLRGDSLRKRGETREALFSYLRTVVLYFRQKHAYQKALYWSSICAARYGLPNRAEELANELKYRFPTSQWHQRLEKDLPAAIQEGTQKGR
jgi:outer membrane protein assembly factor BamD (BamD/ComL family)